jgi:hypothetical protein
MLLRYRRMDCNQPLFDTRMNLPLPYWYSNSIEALKFIRYHLLIDRFKVSTRPRKLSSIINKTYRYCQWEEIWWSPIWSLFPRASSYYSSMPGKSRLKSHWRDTNMLIKLIVQRTMRSKYSFQSYIRCWLCLCRSQQDESQKALNLEKISQFLVKKTVGKIYLSENSGDRELDRFQ